jgi:hypothetical protein
MATRESLVCGRMEAYLRSRASLFRLILAHISYSNKPPVEGGDSYPPITSASSSANVIAVSSS